jgi:hypothetical protein
VNVNLHIERLILEGLDTNPAQRRVLKSAIESELGQLLTTAGVSPEIRDAGALARIETPSIQLGRADEPSKLGTQIAGAIYGGIGT